MITVGDWLGLNIMNPYTASFLIAIEILLDHEMGYVWHPEDPGGETNFGISKRSYPNEDIKNMTRGRAMEIYYNDFWLPCRCDNMQLAQAIQMLDSAANHGIPRAKKILQQAVNVKPDGAIGPLTLAAMSNMPNEDILLRYMGFRIQYFTSLKTFDTFGRGWMNRMANNAIISALYN